MLPEFFSTVQIDEMIFWGWLIIVGIVGLVSLVLASIGISR